MTTWKTALATSVLVLGTLGFAPIVMGHGGNECGGGYSPFPPSAPTPPDPTPTPPSAPEPTGPALPPPPTTKPGGAKTGAPTTPTTPPTRPVGGGAAARRGG